MNGAQTESDLEQPAGDEPDPAKRGLRQVRALLVILLFVLLLGLCVAPTGLRVLLEVPAFLLAGWAVFVVRRAGEVTVVWPDVLFALAALAVFAGGTHAFCRWLARERLAEGRPAPAEWRGRWSAALVALVVLMFAAGTAAIGIAHQAVWLVTSDEPIITETSSPRAAADRSQSMNNLKQIGLALHNYHDTYAVFPPGGTFDRYGQAQHSWATHLLPYIDEAALSRAIDLQHPWNHPANAEPMRTELSVYLNPGFKGEHRRDAAGYALAHYAANLHLLRPNGWMRIKDIPDGTSNTILAGEVAGRFKPWGHPANWRDPADGVNRSPGGFGSPFKGGANFLLSDGSVRFVQENIAPQILKALSTPAGGEIVPEF